MRTPHDRANDWKASRRVRLPAGFTLIEACAIVAVLAVVAVLVPQCRRTLSNVNRASCASNLKQIALGVFQYAEDNDGRFPRTTTPGPVASLGGPSVHSWREAIYPYIKSHDIYCCPQSGYGRWETSTQDGFSLSYDVTDTGPVRVDRSVRERDVTSPYDTILLFEKTASTAEGQQIGVRWDHDSGAPGWTNILYGGHRMTGLAGSNYLFADGHIPWLLPMQTVAGGTNRWHLNTNDPVSPRAMEKLKAAQQDFQD